MSNDEAKLLKLGDYVIRSIENQSDAYYMVTSIENIFKLRKIGNHELLLIEDINAFENFTKIDTNRD